MPQAFAVPPIAGPQQRGHAAATSESGSRATAAPPRQQAGSRLANTGDECTLYLTDVAIRWRADAQEDWLKFGKPVAQRIVSRSRRIESYASGQVFALVRWASNDFGTIRSTLAVVRAVAPGEPCTTIANVTPGGELLLHVRSWTKVAQVFRLIDAIEASGIDPCDVAPEHWRQVHNRLAGRETPRPYTLAQHRAWLLRKALQL